MSTLGDKPNCFPKRLLQSTLSLAMRIDPEGPYLLEPTGLPDLGVAQTQQLGLVPCDFNHWSQDFCVELGWGE